jgi:superfamily II helicase
MLKEIIVKIKSPKEAITLLNHAKKLGYRMEDEEVKHFLNTYAIVFSPYTIVRHCSQEKYYDLARGYQPMTVEEFLSI